MYARDGVLLAAPFDVERLEVTGEPVAIVDDVLMEAGGVAHFDLSDTGVLIYAAGEAVTAEGRLVWVDRSGHVDPLPTPTANYGGQLDIAPDGLWIAVMRSEGNNSDVWIVDAVRGTLVPFTTDPGEDFSPTWSPDGVTLAFASEMLEAARGPQLWWGSASREAPVEPLAVSSDRETIVPHAWSPDGTRLIVGVVDRQANDGIWTIVPEAGAELEAFHVTAFREGQAAISPDGAYVAFSSDESGAREVYLKRTDGTGGATRVSVDGGTEPLWAPSGAELFYRKGDAAVAVSLETGSSLSIGAPTTLFEGRFIATDRLDNKASWDIHPDGERFLMVQSVDGERPAELQFIVNWHHALDTRAPTGQ